MNDIIRTLEAAGSFRTFLSVLQRSELAGDLEAAGPFTLFAPDDAAFERVKLEVVAGDRRQAADLLRYHLVPGKLSAEEIARSDHLPTRSGKSLTVRREDGRQVIDNAGYIESDIECSNGMLHVIDNVFLPRMSGWYCGGC